jgi:signal transduction histidine kinase
MFSAKIMAALVAAKALPSKDKVVRFLEIAFCDHPNIKAARFVSDLRLDEYAPHDPAKLSFAVRMRGQEFGKFVFHIDGALDPASEWTLVNACNLLAIELDHRQFEDILENEVIQQTEKLQTAFEHAEIINRQQINFLGNISHEIRTPLNAILGFSKLIADEVFGPVENARYAEYVAMIHSAAKELNGLVDELLELSSGHDVKLVMGDCRVADIVQQCIKEISPLANDKNIRVGLSVPEHECILLSHSRSVRKIVSNIIGNAIKFTPRGGKVDVVVKQAEPYADLSFAVFDDGPGIPEKDRARLLLPFQRDHKVTDEHGGYGIGLALVDRLLKRLNGHLAFRYGSNDRFVVEASFRNPSSRSAPLAKTSS